MKLRLVLPLLLLTGSWLAAATPVTILSQPAGALVMIDGQKVGLTPLNNHLLEPGEYTFQLELKGYAPVIREATVHAARHLELEFRLNQLCPVLFKSRVSGLRFEVGGQSWDAAKIRLTMEAGRHPVRVYAGSTLVDSLVLVVDGPLKYYYDPR